MKNERILLDELPQRVPIPYPLFLILLFVLIFLIFLFFGREVRVFELGNETDVLVNHFGEFAEYPTIIGSYLQPYLFPKLSVILVISLCIPYLLWSFGYLNKKIKTSLTGLKFEKNEQIPNTDYYITFKSRLISSNGYYATFICMLVPILTMHLLLYDSYWKLEGTLAALLLDLYDITIKIIILFLLSNILWAIFSLAWSLENLTKMPWKRYVIFDIINADEVGGFGHIGNLVFKVIIQYSICISLIILIYYEPFDYFSFMGIDFSFTYESFILMIIFILGVISLLYGLNKMQALINYKKELVLDSMNRIYQIQHQKLLELVENDEEELYLKDFTRISAIFSTLHSDWDIARSIKGTMYDYRSIIALITSILLPIITKIIEIKVLNTP